VAGASAGNGHKPSTASIDVMPATRRHNPAHVFREGWHPVTRLKWMPA
jgi:hypothetical protein